MAIVEGSEVHACQPQHPFTSLLGRPSSGDGSCRNGYGVPVIAQWGTRCAYCNRDLAETYETWLDVSVDHVVPANRVKYANYPVQWVEDLLNLRTCCRACNEFLNAFNVPDPAPDDLEGFASLVESVLEAKRVWVLNRHQVERSRYQAWRDPLFGNGPAASR